MPLPLRGTCSRTDVQDICDGKQTGRISSITVQLITLWLNGAPNLTRAMWSAGQSDPKAKRLSEVEEVYTRTLHFTVSVANADMPLESVILQIWLFYFKMSFFSVFRNGDLLCPPFRFIIPRSMRQDLEQILGLITDKVSLRTGAVRRSVTPEERHRAENEASSGTACVPSGCARWKERPCPRPLSWRPATTTLLWEPRDWKNYHMWSCCSPKTLRGIVISGQ